MSVTSVLRELLFSQRADHRGPGGAPHESDCALASEGKGPRPRPRPRPLDKAAGMQIAVHVVKGDAYAQDRTYVHGSGTHAQNEPVPLVHHGRPQLEEMHP